MGRKKNTLQDLSVMKIFLPLLSALLVTGSVGQPLKRDSHSNLSVRNLKETRRSIRDTQETLKEVISSKRELQGSYNQQREPSDGQSLIEKIMSSHYLLLRTT